MQNKGERGCDISNKNPKLAGTGWGPELQSKKNRIWGLPADSGEKIPTRKGKTTQIPRPHPTKLKKKGYTLLKGDSPFVHIRRANRRPFANKSKTTKKM